MQGEDYHPPNYELNEQEIMNEDINAKDFDVHKDILGGFNPRIGFIRKVYSILSC